MQLLIACSHRVTIRMAAMCVPVCVPAATCVQVEEALKAEGVADDGHIEKKPDRCMVHLWSKGWWMDVLLLRNEAEGVGPGMAGIGAMCSGKSWLDRCSRCPRRRFARWRVSRWTEPASAEWRRP